ncbi:MAG TPA: hypothetical protein VLH94_00280 [Spirochaetia bacterium]|nr:hypothetical protein [Spirochaetia bacterium]
MFGLITVGQAKNIASALLEASGTTLKDALGKINTQAIDLENEARVISKAADTDEVTAQNDYRKTIADAQAKLDATAKSVAKRRQEASEKEAKAASKKKSVSMLA